MSLIIEWLFPRRCVGCGKGNKYLCSLCESKLTKTGLYQKKNFEGVISIYKHDGAIKNLVEKIKYEFIRDAIEEMATLMVRNLKLDYPNVVKYWQKKKFVMVAIPLHWQRENWRGFNQSEELAKRVAKMLELEFDKGLIFRKRNSKNQASIVGTKNKLKNIGDIFGVKTENKIPRKIILVDDVITSGATMTAAQRILKISVPLLWALSLTGVRK